MNRIFITGNLGRDPEVRTAKSGIQVASFSVADTYRKSKDDKDGVTSWFNIVAFDKLAERCSGLIKGQRVTIEGRCQEEEYEAKDGTKKKAWKVLANTVTVDPIARGASGGTTAPDAGSKADELLNEIPF